MRSELKNYLSSSGLAGEADIQRAEQHAGKEKISFQQSLVDLEILKISDLGKSISEISSLPYKKLSGLNPPKTARDAVSMKSARHWCVFPVDYNPTLNLTTIAVKDSAHAKKMSRIYRFLLDTQDVAFTVASEVEIKAALDDLFPSTNKPARPPQTKTLRTKEKPAQPEAEQGKKQLLQWKTDTVKKEPVAVKPLVAGKTAEVKPKAKPSFSKPADDHAEQLLKSLSSAVSMLVTAHLSDEAQALSMVRASARYCQLIAVRLNFTTEQTVRLVIAAWLSALKDKPEVIRQFSSPYDLESIIFSEGTERESVEALVLDLISCYQDIERKGLGDFRDVNFVRRHLHIEWPGSGTRQDIIETFLQILMDEQFISKLDEAAGTILLLDFVGSEATDVESPLTRAGYNVHVVGTIEDAMTFSYETMPDFIIANATKNEAAVIDFCKKMKADDNSSAVPLEVLVPESSKMRGAEFLRAGADDFLSLPVDIELLYLKIEKQMTAASARPGSSEEGVTGSLSDMSFCDMLQMLNVSAKSMDITVTRGEETGRVTLQQGNVIHSELGDIIGENAFYQLMQWDDGSFAMVECTDFPEPTVTSSTMSLLMEGARLADEANRPE